MGALFRSEEMALAQMFIQPEAAYYVLSELGESGCVQFKDLNRNVNVFQRKFVSEVRRCDEMERKLRYIETEVKKDGVTIPKCDEVPRAPNPREMIDLETRLEKTENEIKELSESAVNLKSNYLELTELHHVLDKTHHFFIEYEESSGMDSLHRTLLPEDSHAISLRGRLGFVTGVINRERLPGFERMLWRISRGNVFLKQAEIEKPLEDPATGYQMHKTVFVAFFQGEQLKSIIKKVCAGFHGSLYKCPGTSVERMEMLKGVKTRLEDLNLVLNKTHDHRQRVLIAVANELKNWSVMVTKIKAIYYTISFLNMDVTKRCLIGECWIPLKDLPIVQQALSDGSSASGFSIPSFFNVISTNEDPPTFNRTNKFTKGFQTLIDSYGLASYREANPALYTIITFPFLFAVMFGDVGHGSILLFFALYMVIWEKQLLAKKIKSEIWHIMFSGRYIILLMGIFSIYTGLIYNDVFSKSMHIFRSKWTINYNTSTIMTNHDIQLNPAKDFNDETYPFGMDPVWQLASNKIIFLNSYKMKMSIVIGVVHMIFGVCISVLNHIYFKKYVSIVLEFIPQFIFLVFLFFWMVSMMFLKWSIYGTRQEDLAYKPGCAPSVLIMFINMVLFKNTEPEENCKEFIFERQPALQKVLLFSSLVCIPVLLLGKPFYIKMARQYNRTHHTYKVEDVDNGIEMTPEMANEGKIFGAEPTDHEEKEETSEIFIHQAIHTIEYVLSTISHTASYLRLWALSLAHSQLSDVMWAMVLKMGLTDPSILGSIKLFVFFAVWATFTVGILVMMEGLSAFLHTLRLHWVEFMSKFYNGLGYPFHPFSFKAILETEESEDDL